MNYLQKKTFVLLTFFLFLFSFLSCDKQTTPVENKTPNISLAVDEVAVTEVWLTLQTENLLDKDVLQVLRDDSVIYTGKPGLADTTVYDSGLLPARSYSYHATLIRNDQLILESKPQSITTMDTTSHEFTWTIDTIGIYGSVLYDVAMIDENDIWAVGEIHTPETDKYDSLGNWVPPFNAIHWDGQSWECIHLMKITNGLPRIIVPIRGIIAYSDTNLWLAAGSIYHWDGQIATLSYERNIGTLETVEKLWAESVAKIYGMGNSGLIVNYYGSYWQELGSGTDMPIQDIWGAPDLGSDKYLILAVASPKYNWQKPLLLNLSKYPVKPEFLSVYNLLHSIWFETPRKIFLCGDGVHYRVNETWNRVEELPTIFYNRIRGSGLNNIWVVGDFGVVLHYNGVTWKEIPGLWLSTGNYEGLAIKDNLTVAVGWKGEVAIIVKNF
jgi:hypothetical protein